MKSYDIYIMKIVVSPVVNKQMVTEDSTSYEMFLDILTTHEEDPDSLFSCLQKYLDSPHEIPVRIHYCNITTLQLFDFINFSDRRFGMD